MRDEIDAFLGERVERIVRSHHRRRLKRIGWAHALDALPGTWASAPPEPREGNEVEILVDGEAALPAIARAVAGAHSSVHLAGWYFSPHFQLEERGASLRELLAETAERVDVRMLAWAGAPLPLFHPDRKEVRQTFELLAGGTRIRYALDARERPMHCHHEKIVIVDGELAFVGGIDLTTLEGDRFDRSDHPARGAHGWHDATALLRGPAVADVADHFALRWREVTGETLPATAPLPEAGGRTVQVVRTVPEKVYDALPRGDFTLLEAYMAALRGAERYVYLESQFLWSPEIVEVLRHKLRRPPCDEFRLVVVLPARPNNGREDTRGQIGVLVDADDGGGRFLACALYQTGAWPPQGVYVHAKIGIVDDRWLTIGSANLNEHSLFNDTEMNLVAHDPELALRTRRRLWAEHLELPPDQIPADPIRAIDELWKPISERQHQRRTSGQPLTHRLVRLPHVSRRTSRILGPINGMLVDG